MSKTVINKREQLKWNNGFDPNGKSIPDITTEDEGKFIKVENGVLAFREGGGGGSTYTAGDNIEISSENEISSVNTIVFDVKYFRSTDTFQYDADAIAPFLTEVFKNDKRAVVRVQEGNYNNYDIYTLTGYQSGNKAASFSKVNPSIVSANQREIVCSHIALYISNGVGTLTYTNEGVTDLPEGATQGQIPISDGHNGWVAGNIPTELPSVSSSDEGKVLKVDSNGDWVAGTDNDTTYTAGEGIDITSQVVSSPDAVMAKEGIADKYEGLTFYPIATSASTSMNMEADCMVAIDCDFNRVAGVRVYSTNGVNGYWCVKKDNGGARLLVFVPGATDTVTIRSQHIDAFGAIDDNEMPISRTFVGSVNSGRYGDTTVNPFGDGNHPLVQCAYDLTNCVYSTDQDAINEFGGNPIPTENYNEGEQVWKDGKLQTYTSGGWVDSDTIVEQIANSTYTAGTGIAISANNEISSTLKGVPSTGASKAGKVLAVATDSPYGYSWENSTIVYTITYDSDTETYSLPSGVTFSSINSLLNKGRAVELLYDTHRHHISTITNNQLDFDATVAGMAGLVKNSTIRVKSNNTVTVNVTASPAMPNTESSSASILYSFTWDADSAAEQTYTATEDCYINFTLRGIGGLPGSGQSSSAFGLDATIYISKDANRGLLYKSMRSLSPLTDVAPSYSDSFFLRKGFKVTINHPNRNSGTLAAQVSSFRARKIM